MPSPGVPGGAVTPTNPFVSPPPVPVAPSAPPAQTQAQGSPVLAAGGVRPTAAEVSRVMANDLRSVVYVIKATGAVEECFAHLNIIEGLIYCIGGDSGGELQQTGGATTSVGRSLKYLTEVRLQGEQNTPILISETSRGELQSARRWVKGTAGDKLLLLFRQ